jgi:5-formyltetrahydrofolate cyclo-ligase
MTFVARGSSETKAQARARVRAARGTRTSPERAAAAEGIARHALPLVPDEPVVLGAYVSLPAEPGTGPLLDGLHRSGHRVLLPRVVGAALEWVAWSAATPMTRGAFGIEEPAGDRVPGDLAGVAVLFVPALSVDRAGRRLGQGGGFYDRTLAQVPTHADGGPLRVACVFADEIVDTVPHEPHDLRVDIALTQFGIIRFP